MGGGADSHRKKINEKMVHPTSQSSVEGKNLKKAASKGKDE